MNSEFGSKEQVVKAFNFDDPDDICADREGSHWETPKELPPLSSE